MQQLLLVTGAPEEYWCFALEYVAFIKARTAKRRLQWRTSFEFEFGAVPDISKCRFAFWQPVWFYTPRNAFPRQRMMKARFLGFSPDSGDDFTYIIVTEPESESEAPQIFTRSVIRPRHIRDDVAPIVIQRGRKTLEIYHRDERTVLKALPDPDFPVELSAQAQNPLPTIQEEPSDADSVDEYERAIEEVYGSSPKRLRIDPTSEACVRSDPEELQPRSILNPPSMSVSIPREDTTTEILATNQEMQPEIVLVANTTPDVPDREPVPAVTQEEQDMETDDIDEDPGPFPDDDSVHSADENLDEDKVSTVLLETVRMKTYLIQ